MILRLEITHDCKYKCIVWNEIKDAFLLAMISLCNLQKCEIFAINHVNSQGTLLRDHRHTIMLADNTHTYTHTFIYTQSCEQTALILGIHKHIQTHTHTHSCVIINT